MTLAALVDDIGRDDAVIHRQISARGFLDKLVDEVLYGQVRPVMVAAEILAGRDIRRGLICGDVGERMYFYGLLKRELLYLQEFRSMEHFKLELIEYLDYYNNRRIKAKLKGLPPAIHRQ